MNRRVMGGLLGAAVTLTVLVAPTATASDAAACGTPAVPAVIETVTQPAGEQTIPAVTHLEWLWTRTVPVHERQYELTAAGYKAFVWVRESGVIEGPDGEQTSSKEAILLPKGAVPSGDGWELSGETFWVKDANAKVWSLTPPAGTKWEATGKKRVAFRETETTTEHSALPPAGSGWVKVPGSEIVVVDVAEQVVVHEEPWTEEVVVSPAVPAGEPCPSDDPTQDPTDDPTAQPAAPAGSPSTEPTVLGVQENRAPAAAEAPAAVPTAVDAGVGPTGSDTGAWPWLGGLVVLGAAAGAAGSVTRCPARKH